MGSVQPDSSADTAEHPLQRSLIWSGQLALYPVLAILRLLFVRQHLYRHRALSKLDPAMTYVLYGNHQSMLDPLVVCASMPVRSLRAVLPFRFFIENAYFKGAAKPVLNLLGGFPAHYEPDKAYGLDKARAVMADKQTVVIFPPGRRTRQHIAKPGIAVLAAEPNVALIPVHIDWKHRWHCHVRIGQPISAAHTRSPEAFMELVYGLVPTTT